VPSRIEETLGEGYMIVCETDFELPDRKNPDYTMTEVDFYSHIPYGKDFPQHRLTLRKNLKTMEYEIIRAYQQRYFISRKGVSIDTGKETGQVEVAFKHKDLQTSLDFANKEVEKFWADVHQDTRDRDKACQHKPPILHYRCRIWAETSVEEKIRLRRRHR